ncbi:MAG: hypothetical protein MUF54_24690 [Polyangiaceae bacterium]|jgi:short subunit dehydrogenase-like uncharacterized protein|nr:hypothetical protein [Polyangiaceae bacterium]
MSGRWMIFGARALTARPTVGRGLYPVLGGRNREGNVPPGACTPACAFGPAFVRTVGVPVQPVWVETRSAADAGMEAL